MHLGNQLWSCICASRLRLGRGSTVLRHRPARLFSGSLATVTDADATKLSSIVGAGNVITDGDRLAPMNTDWLRQYRGNSRLAVRPRSTAEVAAVVRHCRERGLRIVPQGGNTGLVGGSVPMTDEVILQLGRMDSIVSFDPSSGVLVAEAGAILSRLEEFLNERGYTMPLDLGSKGSCQIGGNVSTNAGGLRLLRYGSLHGSVLGLTAVAGTGEVLDCMNVLRKDNVGFDLKQLFIGSEGTLGIVTHVAIQAVAKLSAQNVALFGVGSFSDAVALASCARSRLGEILSAVEFVDEEAMRLEVRELYGWDFDANTPLAPLPMDSSKTHSQPPLLPPSQQQHQSCPIPLSKAQHPFYVLIETSGSNAEHDAQKLDSFLTRVASDPASAILAEMNMGKDGRGGTGGALGVDESKQTPMMKAPSSLLGSSTGRSDDAPLVRDGVVAADGKQASAIWRLREEASLAVSKRGHVFKYDLSFPMPRMYDIVGLMRERLGRWQTERDVRTVGYGHLGDGNVHLNISTRDRDVPYLKDLEKDIEPFLFDWTIKNGGSVSAEHGLGQAKAHLLPSSKPAPVVAAMHALKQLFDPSGILNPGKVLLR